MYLVRNNLEVLGKRGTMIKEIKSNIDRLLENKDENELQKYEDYLLKEFECAKLRIDVLIGEGKEEEMYDMKLTLTALNLMLHYMIEENPKSELGSFMNKELQNQ